jgi:hypothetical protein
MKPGKVIAAAGDSSMALLAWVLGGGNMYCQQMKL